MRMHLMIAMLASAIEKAGSTEAGAVAKALEGAQFRNGFHHATMRAADHQLLQPLYVSVMQKKGEGVRFDNEGSGYGFRTERYLSEQETALPTSCRMVRPTP
jgi:branched-chain amino acid transport system substrate-binding protein